MTTIDKAAMEMVLSRHEIIRITTTMSPPSWEPVVSAHCRCGYEAEPSRWAMHLSDELVKTIDVWLITET